MAAARGTNLTESSSTSVGAREVLTRGGFSGKRPARRRRTEGTRKGPPSAPSHPCLYNNHRQGERREAGVEWRRRGPLVDVLLARCPAITHTCRGEREGVPDGQAFCLYQWEEISGMLGAGQSREGKEEDGFREAGAGEKVPLSWAVQAPRGL